MKKYTQEEFDNFETVNGIKQCPSGDYTLINEFKVRCSFAEWCIFADGCNFAVGCSFANECRFANFCSFAKECNFASGCRFAKLCSFDNECSFAEYCSFASGCSFAKWCSFASRCSFAERCSFENLKFAEAEKVYFISINNIGSRLGACYIFNAINGLHVRCGCWFGTANDFLKAVEERHKGTIHEKTYKLAVEMAKVQFGKD